MQMAIHSSESQISVTGLSGAATTGAFVGADVVTSIMSETCQNLQPSRHISWFEELLLALEQLSRHVSYLFDSSMSQNLSGVLIWPPLMPAHPLLHKYDCPDFPFPPYLSMQMAIHSSELQILVTGLSGTATTGAFVGAVVVTSIMGETFQNLQPSRHISWFEELLLAVEQLSRHVSYLFDSSMSQNLSGFVIWPPPMPAHPLLHKYDCPDVPYPPYFAMQLAIHSSESQSLPTGSDETCQNLQPSRHISWSDVLLLAVEQLSRHVSYLSDSSMSQNLPGFLIWPPFIPAHPLLHK